MKKGVFSNQLTMSFRLERSPFEFLRVNSMEESAFSNRQRKADSSATLRFARNDILALVGFGVLFSQFFRGAAYA